jgi:hypothetical protein
MKQEVTHHQNGVERYPISAFPVAENAFDSDDRKAELERTGDGISEHSLERSENQASKNGVHYDLILKCSSRGFDALGGRCRSLSLIVFTSNDTLLRDSKH